MDLRPGNGKAERRSLSFDRLYPDAAPVLLDDVARDREAEAGPAAATPDARAIDLVEPFEDPSLRPARDTDSIVGHRRHNLIALDADRNHHVAAVGAELHGVVQEVDVDLREPRRVAPHAWDDSP